MRVYELDEAYGVSKELVKAALELAGLKTHNMSSVDEEELGQFEAALESLQDEAEEESLPEVSDEEQEAPASPGEPREAVDGFEDGELSTDSEELENTEPAPGEKEEVMTLDVVEMNGQKKEGKDGEFEFPNSKIGTAVGAWLGKDRKLASASNTRDGVCVVSWPDMQKKTFR